MADDEILIRLRLQNQGQFVSGVKSVDASIKGVRKTADEAGRSLDTAGKRSIAMSAALYGVRRAAFLTTFGIGGLATAAVKMGFSFNSGMEQSRIAFTQFLGSTQAANRELGVLFQLAAKTPFETANIRTAATEFLGFGFNVKQTNQYLRILGDTVSGLPNLGAEGVGRLAVVFGQIRASGRLLGQDLLQLTQAGIPAIDILTKQLNLRQSQVNSLLSGQLRIPSSTAIPALFRGLQQRYGGLAAKQANTFSGLTSTAHDYLSQLLGTATGPLFADAERGLRRLNPLLQQMTAAFKQGGMTAMVRTVDQAVGANGRLVTGWKQLASVGTALGHLFTGVIVPAVGAVIAIVGPGSKIFGALAAVLGFAARHTTLLKIALTFLAARLVILKGTAIATRVVLGGLALAARAWAVATGLVTAAQWALNVALDANPIGLVILAAAGLATGLYFLITRVGGVKTAFANAFRAVKTAAGATIGFVKREWPLLTAVMTGGMSIAVTQIIRHFGQIKAAFATAINWVIGRINVLIGAWNHLGFKLPGIGRVGAPKIGMIGMVGANTPRAARGGTVTRGGTVMIGERGPEVLSLPTGATVSPLTGGHGKLALDDSSITRLAAAVARAVDGLAVQLDGRHVGNVVAKRVLDAGALA